MKKLLILFIVTSMFAYQKDDNVDIGLAKKIEMESEKIYVVDFFASWCASCKKEIPLISKANTLIDRSKVEIIGIDVDVDIKKAKSFQEELKKRDALNFRVIDDSENSIVKIFNPKAMPAIFFIKDSKVIEVIYGAVDGIDEVVLNTLKGMQK
jgi:thiol-disulfide isomerase/thioredoxin